MTEKEIKRRLIATNILFWLGLLICVGAIGRLDYLTEQHITYGIKELWLALGRGVGGLFLMMTGALVGRKLELDESEDDDGNA